MIPPTTLTPFPAIQTRPQLEAVLQNIAQLHREREQLHSTQENEIAAIRHKYRPLLSEVENYLELETTWAEAWARAHPEFFSPDRTLACSCATLGFRAEPPRLERASRRWTWSRIATTLASLNWGKHYLRVPPPEVDREALLADLGRLSPEELRSAGLRLVQGETFFISPPGYSETSAHPTSEPAWSEAA